MKALLLRLVLAITLLTPTLAHAAIPSQSLEFRPQHQESRLDLNAAIDVARVNQKSYSLKAKTEVKTTDVKEEKNTDQGVNK